MPMQPYNAAFLETDNELRAYVLGLFTADGWISKKTVFLSLTDQQVMLDLARMIGYTKDFIISQGGWAGKRDGKLSYRIGLSGPAYEYIRSLGFDRVKTGQEFFSIKAVSDATFPHYLRGFSDGDGYFSLVQNRGRRLLQWGAVCANAKFLEELATILECLCPMTDRARKVLKHGTAWKIQYGHQDAVLLGNFVYANASISIQRKRDVYEAGVLLQTGKSAWTTEETALALSGMTPPGRSKAAYYAFRRKLELQGVTPR